MGLASRLAALACTLLAVAGAVAVGCAAAAPDGAAGPSPGPGPASNPGPATSPAPDAGVASARAIVIDHRHVDASAIPVAYLDAARRLDVVFQHKSVGYGMTDALKKLGAGDPGRYRVEVVGWPYWWSDENGGHDGTPPSVAWYATHDAIGNWENGRNGDAASKTSGFDALVRGGYGDVAHVAVMKFCFTEMWSGAGADTWKRYRETMEALIRDYPRVKFVWVTMPLAYVGSFTDAYDYGRPTHEFNELLRAYVAAKGGYLLDVAEIEARSTDGTAHRDSRGRPSIAPEWAVATDDPHLNAAGSARLANAWWHLMARIAGWSP